MEEPAQETYPVISTWPAPPGCPLYVSVDRAAKIAGVSYEDMRAWVDRVQDPIPYITVGKLGKKKLVSVAAMPEWMRKRERA